MIKKQFSQAWHDSNDPQSRVAIIEYLNTMGFPFESNKDKYGLDLVSLFSAPFKIGLELEHRSIWTKEEYPYSTVHIPSRKGRLLGNDHIHYVVLSKDFDRMGICLGSVLKAYLGSSIHVPNKAVATGERFYDVPKECFKWVKIK